jgi:hypothetical protein
MESPRMSTLTQQQQDTVVVRQSTRICDYIQAHGIENETQRGSLLALIESWEKFSVDMTWDDLLEERLRSKPGLFDFTPEPKTEEKPSPAAKEIIEATTGLYKTEIKAINISQPDAMTCQSACIGMATGNSNVAAIRSELDAQGVAGDPAIMANMLRKRLGDRYIYNGKASLEDMKGWLRAGEFLIIHTFLTPSGHVISLDGLKDVAGSEDFFDVKDPWSEFGTASFSYDNPNVSFYDGFYSARLIYAAAVKAFTFEQAINTYRSGELDSNFKGAWVHRCAPGKA